MNPYSSDSKNTIIKHLKDGLSTRAIAEISGMSKSTISNIRKGLNETLPKPKSGAKPKLTTRDKRVLVSLITNQQAKTATEAAKLINESLDKSVSRYTASRALKQAGLQAKKKVKKPMISEKNRKARLQWAQDRQFWTVDDWSRIIWSDETKINRLCSDGINYVWIHEKENQLHHRTNPTVKFGGGSIMIWGSMTYSGVGKVAKIDGKMDANLYCEILRRNLLPTIDACSILPEFPARDKLIFQQDNDPKHTSSKAKKFFQENNIKLLQWPAQSPDLNPIEHLWHHLKCKIGKLPRKPKGILELWEIVQAEWEKIDPSYVKALIESLPRRVEAVIKAKGLQTKY